MRLSGTIDAQKFARQVVLLFYGVVDALGLPHEISVGLTHEDAGVLGAIFVELSL